MKRLLSLLLLTGLLATDLTAEAQQTRRTTRKRARRARTAPAGDSTYTFATRNERGTMGKSISESTTGVLGEDTIRVNQKGATRNLNYNTGVPLPPNTGGSSR